jgi:DNA-directed RNA polymerase
MIDRREGTVDEQLLIEEKKEKEGIAKIVREVNKAIDRGDFSDTVHGKVLVKLGYEPYVDKLKEYLNTTLYSHQKKVRELLLLLCDDMEQVAYIAITACIGSSIRNRPLTSTAMAIVRSLRDIYFVNKLERDNPKLHTYLGAEFRRASKKQKRTLIKKHIDKLYRLGEDEKEDNPIMTQLGTTLINILELSGSNIIKVVKTSTNRKGKVVPKNVVTLTEEASEILTNLEYSDLFTSVIKPPMIVPPKDWTNNYDGGFLKGKNFLFTVTSNDVRKHLKKGKYPKVYNVINKLQKTPWRVNLEMLEVIQTIYNNNMIDPKSPSLAPTLYGGLPTQVPYSWKDFINKDMYDKWHDFNREREAITIRADGEQSRRLELVYTLSVADTMKHYGKLYYPYVLDYRGRVYSSVAFLTPQGQGYTKSLLEFGNGRHLTDIGVFWLKIHISNTYGNDKLSYEDRIEWVDNNLSTIIKVANDPMGNLKDWVWVDSPYEYLAACKAWRDHTEGKEIYLPIQLDATNSGVQMYSGLLRDPKGGQEVNVINKVVDGNIMRADIYQVVADKVNNYLKEGNYSKWVEYTDREGVTKSAYTVDVAKSMIGKITRSIVKRNVMTVPYSVTRQGMSNQLWDVMDEAMLKGKPFWEGDKWIANKILTQLSHEAIYDTIEGAKKGQEYLVELSKSLNKPAQWTGVLYDFPLRQTSLTLKEVRVNTIYGRLLLNVEEPKLNKRRQSNSIAPNFIHNIDSTVLLYCVENIQEDIGVIHDCFLVHANDGDDIQGWYKDGYVIVMRLDPLRNIQQQLDPEHIVPFPEYGSLELNDVYRSKYIIS